MDWNIRGILELFDGKARVMALVVVAVVVVTILGTVPVTKAYFASESRNCSHVLDENLALTKRIVEISALFREYSAIEELQERRQLQSLSEERRTDERPATVYVGDSLKFVQRELIHQIGELATSKLETDD